MGTSRYRLGPDSGSEEVGVSRTTAAGKDVGMEKVRELFRGEDN